MTPEIDKKEVNLALRVAIEAARDHRGCAPETCGGSRLDPCSLANALEALRLYQESKGYVDPLTGPPAGGFTGIINEPGISIVDPAPAPVWVETDMRQCLAGDRIRMGASEANVLRSVSGVWHADNGDAWHPRGWEHLEFRAELDVVPGFRQYPPNASIEILCTPERRAILLLQDAFPGSAVTSSDVN